MGGTYGSNLPAVSYISSGISSVGEVAGLSKGGVTDNSGDMLMGGREGGGAFAG